MKGYLLAAILLLAQEGEDQAALITRLQKEQRTNKLTWNTPNNWTAPERSAATDGAVFSFTRRPTAVGTIFDTDLRRFLEGEIEWSVAGIRDDKNLVVETCDVHSPASVYVAALPPLPCTVTVKGIRRWYCDVPVEFKGTVEGATQRVGGFTLTVQWPDIVVTADRAVAQHVVPRLLGGWEIGAKLKPDAPRRNGLRENLVARTGRVKGPVKNPAWCGCSEKPTRGGRPPVPTMTTWKILVTGYAGSPVEDIEWISFRFHLPVEEPFEVTSPPLP
jgi:hypothetical protein